jgi:hypothetical protein
MILAASRRYVHELRAIAALRFGDRKRAFFGAADKFNFDKRDLIDLAYRRCDPAPGSFADLGGIWNVDGAYTYYTLAEHGAARAFLVDFAISEAATRASRGHRGLTLIKGNFASEQVMEKIGEVDAVFLFDVLLHQVKPDWDEILRAYAKRTRYFVIYNQQWTGSTHTVRLLDLGEEEYFRNIPPNSRDLPSYSGLFEKLHERVIPEKDRVWRDMTSVWQWGITDGDLLEAMQGLGFKMQHYRNCGRFGALPNFENHGFVFQRAF